MTKSKWR